MQFTWWFWLVCAIGSTFCHVHSIVNSYTAAKIVSGSSLLYLRLSNNKDCILILIVYTVNSHPFLFGCTHAFRMAAIMMIATIMAMPASTQLAKNRTDHYGY